jgi:hypothetical protein
MRGFYTQILPIMPDLGDNDDDDDDGGGPHGDESPLATATLGKSQSSVKSGHLATKVVSRFRILTDWRKVSTAVQAQCHPYWPSWSSSMLKLHFSPCFQAKSVNSF